MKTSASSLIALHSQRDAILDEIAALPQFRRGTVSEHARTCGKPVCRCRQSPDQRHEAYQWTASINGKTAYKTLHLGPEVEKYLDETNTYKRFKTLLARYIHINEQIADLLDPEPVTTEKELDTLKKKLRTQLSRQHKRKSGV